MSAARPPEGARTAAEGEGVPSLAAPGRRLIDIQGVAQNFKTARGLFPAMRVIPLGIALVESVTLIGQSGCRKSTLLILIAGLATPTNGVLLCANKEIKG